MKAYTVGLTAATLMLAAVASSQILYAQPYTPRQSSFESRVYSCGAPRPFMRVALDDWRATVNSPITRIDFWGTLTNPLNVSKPYYFAVYKNNPATNKPLMPTPIWKTCMTPQGVYQTTDCKQMRVYRFTARFPLSNCFKQVAGERYWLQISEADKESAKLNFEEFRWSGRRPIVNFPAVQYTAAGAFVPSLIDVCDNLRDDLSFVLFRS